MNQLFSNNGTKFNSIQALYYFPPLFSWIQCKQWLDSHVRWSVYKIAEISKQIDVVRLYTVSYYCQKQIQGGAAKNDQM